MPVKINPTSVIKTRLGIEKGGRVHRFVTNECAKEMDRYVPFDEGILAGTVIQNGQPTANVTSGLIIYDQEYAKVVYYGIRNGKSITIHRDKHPDATTYWDKVMWSAKGTDIIRRTQKLINNGGK